MQMEKGFNGYPRAWLLSQHGRGKRAYGDGDAPSNTRGLSPPLR